MVKINHTRLKNLDVQYFLDHDNHKMHVLELQNSNYPKLPNLISPDFQRELVEQENLFPFWMEFKWVYYCLEGPILTCEGYNLSLTNKNDKTLYRPFLEAWEREQ